jgi:hypothetical protein
VYNPHRGIIVALSQQKPTVPAANARSGLHDPKAWVQFDDGSPTARWSDITMLTWQDTCRSQGVPAPVLRQVIVPLYGDTTTMDLLRSIGWQEPHRLQWALSMILEDGTTSFNAILGLEQDVAMLLVQYQEILGRRRIDRIQLWRPKGNTLAAAIAQFIVT